jgi:hypothetical protein
MLGYSPGQAFTIVWNTGAFPLNQSVIWGSSNLAWGTNRQVPTGFIGVGDVSGRLIAATNDIAGQLYVSSVDNCFANDW